jgi:DsbC/DsbD-like thiol-disulfide interchange protein
MNRRDLLYAPLALAVASPSIAANQPWSARLLKGGFDGTVWWSGIAITLEPHWKTYWRVPGDGGIAPSFDISGDNVKSVRVDYPVPNRLVAESGTTLGYMDTVVFPIAITPLDAEKPVKTNLNAFFGVCEEVCIPARFTADVKFEAAAAAAPDQYLINQWQEKVPRKLTIGPLTNATARMIDAKPVLVVKKVVTLVDAFAEGNPAHYFGTPEILDSFVIFPVTGAKSLDELRAMPVRITAKTRSIALEQVMTVV